MPLSLNNYKGILFDLDGVLYDTEPIRFKSYQYLFKSEYGKQLPEHLLPDRVGKSIIDNFNFYLDYLNIPRPTFNKFMQQRNQLLSRLISQEVKENDHLIKLFSEIHALRVTIGLVSNSGYDYIKQVLTQMKIFEFFSVICSGQQLNKFKPDSAIYEYALEQLGLVPEEVIAVEDTNSGIKAAQNAGILCFGIKRDYVESLELKNEHIINSVFDLFNLPDIIINKI